VPLNVEVPICFSGVFFWKNTLCVFFLCLCFEVVLCDLLCVFHLYFSLSDRGFPTFDICFIVLIIESILLGVHGSMHHAVWSSHMGIKMPGISFLE
jgi:heme/copper-type cytochrome/quinol oxidase subunit 4